jgi:hypothetical protein
MVLRQELNSRDFTVDKTDFTVFGDDESTWFPLFWVLFCSWRAVVKSSFINGYKKCVVYFFKAFQIALSN